VLEVVVGQKEEAVGQKGGCSNKPAVANCLPSISFAVVDMTIFTRTPRTVNDGNKTALPDQHIMQLDIDSVGRRKMVNLIK